MRSPAGEPQQSAAARLKHRVAAEPFSLRWQARGRVALGGTGIPGASSFSPAGGLHARRLIRLLLIVRRPGSVARARRLLPPRQLEQRVEAEGVLVDARSGISDPREAA